jgi:hypothetical protein
MQLLQPPFCNSRFCDWTHVPLLTAVAGQLINTCKEVLSGNDNQQPKQQQQSLF